MSQRHVQPGDNIAQQCDLRERTLAEELECRPSHAVAGHDARVSGHKDGLDSQHDDNLQFQVAHMAHSEGRQAAENNLRDTVRQCDHADLDGIVGEHVQRALGQEAGEGVEHST